MKPRRSMTIPPMLVGFAMARVKAQW